MSVQNGSRDLGGKVRVLLTSVFGPYAQDDEFGSQKINPMELWHNQVTRVQGPFSLRMFNRSFGMQFIQANIQSPCVMLDFPTLDRFIQELKTVQYDIIGVGSITINVLKVKKMCELIRRYQPDAKIVVGGHVGFPWIDELISLTIKFPNFYVDTSAYAVHRLPADFVSFMKGMGQSRVMFGTNWPMLSPAACLKQLDSLDLTEVQSEAFLSGNARRVFNL